MPVTQDRIFNAIGNFCGKSGRTVRYYAETAGFYPRLVRDEFDVLPFSFFVFARYEGDNWRNVLEFALLRPEISLDALKFWWSAQGSINLQDKPDTDVRQQADGELYDAEVSVMDGGTQRDLVSIDSARSLALLYDVIDRAESVIRALPLPGYLGARLMQHINGIKELLPELIKAVRETQ